MRLFNFFKKQATPQEVENAGRLFGLFAEQGKHIDVTTTLLYMLYYKNTDVNAAIRDKSFLIFKDGFFFTDKEGEPIERPDIRLIFNSQKPFRELKQEIITHFDVSGNAFLLKLRNDNGQLVGFQVLDSRLVRITSDETGNIKSYEQTNGGTTVKAWKPEDIVHWKADINPNEPLFGKSPIFAAATDIIADSEAARTNLSYFKNSAIPSTLLKLKDGMTKENKESLIKQMKAQFSGGKNKHKISALNGVDGIMQLQQSLKDMEYKLLREFTTDIVCTSLGVPKTRMNKFDVAYSNTEDVYIQYIESTIRPYEFELGQMFTKIIKEEIDDKLIFAWKDLHIIDEKAQTEIAVMRINNGLETRNQAMRKLGLPESNEEEADKLTVPSSQLFLEDLGIQGLSPEVNE